MTALVLAEDSPIGLTVVRELGRHGVPVHIIARNPRLIAGASRHARDVHVRPSGPAMEWLPDLISRTGARGLLAVSESDVAELAGLPPVVNGCTIATPRAGPLQTVLDKRATLDRAAAIGIDVPVSWQADGAPPPPFDFPVVLKWADPNAVIPTLQARRIPFLKTEYAHSHSDLASALARYDVIGQWPLVQSYAHGTGLGQMLYMHQGRATLRFQHQRLHEWPPEGGVSTLCRAVPQSLHEAQMALSEQLLADIGWEGAAMVEYRYDAARQRYTLMEINGRFWGSLPLASMCGAEFAWETYRRAVLGESGPPAAQRDDLAARYLLPETRRLLHLWRNGGQTADPFFTATPLRDTAGYVAGAIDPHVRHYVWRWDDPGPLLRDAANVVRKVLRGR